MNGPAAVRRQFWFARIVVVQFALMMPIHAMRPMVSYRALELGASPLELGLVAGGYGALSFIFAVPLGRWVDRWGEPRFLVAGTTVSLLAMALLAPAASLPTLAIVYALLGVGQVSTAIGVQALTAGSGRADRRDARFGVTSVSAATSQMVGPPLGGLVYSLTGGSLSGVFSTGVPIVAVSLAMAVTLWSWPPPEREQPRRAVDEPRPTMRRAVGTVLGRPDVPHAMLVSIAAIATTDLITAYLPAYGQASGVSVEIVSVLLGLRAAASIASRIGLIPLVRRLGRGAVLTAGATGAAVALMLLPVSADPVVLGVLLAVAGFGVGVGQPLSLAWISDIIEPELRGTALGLRMTGTRGGQMVIPVVAGVIAGATGVGAVFILTGLMLASSAVVVRRAPSTRGGRR